MLATIKARYDTKLDAALRQAVADIEPPELATMLSYAFGWVDAAGTPTNHIGGKRLRPYLLLLCNEAAGGDWHDALPAAAAVELLHNFSLVHDDIQDHSATRHQRPSMWAAWDRARAINAGDSLLGLAYQCLSELGEMHTPNVVLPCWAQLNGALRELTRGQHLDINFEQAPSVDEATYYSMIIGKTAALLAAAAQMGALLAFDERDEHYGEFGRQLGLAFQIRDDILGIWGDSAVTGKSSSDDLRHKKKSLPTVIGLAREAELCAIFAQPRLTDDEVAQAVALLERCGAREYAEAAEARHGDAALAALERAQPQGEAGDWLRRLPAALLGRRN